MIAGVLFNHKRFIESGIVCNRGVIPNLPAELGVEVPIVADAAGIHPLSLGPMPDPIAKLLTVQANVQQLAVDAAVHGSKERALQALLIDPVINSTTAAVKILDELWEATVPTSGGAFRKARDPVDRQRNTVVSNRSGAAPVTAPANPRGDHWRSMR